MADVIVASGRYYVPETQIRRGVTSEESRKFPLAADCNRHAIILESAIMSNVLEETLKVITIPSLKTLYVCLHNPFVDPPLYQLRADVLSKGDVSNVCLCILLPSLEMADTEMVGSFTGSTFKSNALTLTHAIQDITKVCNILPQPATCIFPCYCADAATLPLYAELILCFGKEGVHRISCQASRLSLVDL